MYSLQTLNDTMKRTFMVLAMNVCYDPVRKTIQKLIFRQMASLRQKKERMKETTSFNYLIITIATILVNATVNGIECVVNEIEIFIVNCFSFRSHEHKK